MCPDWESNWRPFGSQVGVQSTEPHQPGLCLFSVPFRPARSLVHGGGKTKQTPKFLEFSKKSGQTIKRENQKGRLKGTSLPSNVHFTSKACMRKESEHGFWEEMFTLSYLSLTSLGRGRHGPNQRCGRGQTQPIWFSQILEALYEAGGGRKNTLGQPVAGDHNHSTRQSNHTTTDKQDA